MQGQATFLNRIYTTPKYFAWNNNWLMGNRSRTWGSAIGRPGGPSDVGAHGRAGDAAVPSPQRLHGQAARRFCADGLGTHADRSVMWISLRVSPWMTSIWNGLMEVAPPPASGSSLGTCPGRLLPATVTAAWCTLRERTQPAAASARSSWSACTAGLLDPVTQNALQARLYVQLRVCSSSADNGAAPSVAHCVLKVG